MGTVKSPKTMNKNVLGKRDKYRCFQKTSSDYKETSFFNLTITSVDNKRVDIIILIFLPNYREIKRDENKYLISF